MQDSGYMKAVEPPTPCKGYRILGGHVGVQQREKRENALKQNGGWGCTAIEMHLAAAWKHCPHSLKQGAGQTTVQKGGFRVGIYSISQKVSTTLTFM